MTEALRLVIFSGLLAGVGGALLLGELRSFRRVSLTDRLSPFVSSGRQLTGNVRGRRDVTTGDALRTAAAAVAERVSGLLGSTESAAVRLQRARMNIDATGFRLKQTTAAGVGLAAGLVLTMAVQPPVLMAALFCCGGPALGFLLLEQQLTRAAADRQKQIFLELPIVSEQLALLLGAGYSVGAALRRVGERNAGATGTDINQAMARMHQGLTVSQALGEWSDVARVPELTRLVGVLSLGNETSDLGSLVSAEAKAIRQEAQRRLDETIDKRAQQVWVPVTIATLVPGVIFLVIPFVQALRMFSGTP